MILKKDDAVVDEIQRDVRGREEHIDSSLTSLIEKELRIGEERENG